MADIKHWGLPCVYDGFPAPRKVGSNAASSQQEWALH